MNNTNKSIIKIIKNKQLGAQKVGMLKEAYSNNTKVAEMLNFSKDVLKYDLLQICSNGNTIFTINTLIVFNSLINLRPTRNAE